MADLADPLLCCKQVTALLKISTASLYRQMEKGTFPRPIKFGSSNRWPRSEVLQVIEAAKARRSA